MVHRFENYGVMGGKVADVLPTPKELNLQDNMYVDIMTGDWQVVYYDSQLEKNAQYLAGKYNFPCVTSEDKVRWTKCHKRELYMFRVVIPITKDLAGKNYVQGYVSLKYML